MTTLISTVGNKELQTRILKELVGHSRNTYLGELPKPIPMYKTHPFGVRVPVQWAIQKGTYTQDPVLLNPLTPFYSKLRPPQQEIIPDLVKYLSTNGALLLQASCSFGKTIVACYLLDLLSRSGEGPHTSLIVMHNRILLQQWAERIQQFLGPEKEVCMGPGLKEGAINILSFGKLKNVQSEEFGRVSTLIVDEAHMITEKRTQFMFRFTPRFMIALTATPHLATIPELIPTFFSPNVVTRILQKDFSVYKLKTKFKPHCVRNLQGKLDWNEVIRSLCENQERTKFLGRVIEKIVEKNEGVILVLTKRVQHCQDIHAELTSPSCVMTGSTNTWDRECRVLLSTYSKLSVGFDESIISCLVTAMDIVDPEQSTGRIFRNQLPMVMDIVDDFVTLERHWEKREKWYLSRLKDSSKLRVIDTRDE